MKHSDITPFVKWAGGKRQLLEKLDARLPEEYGRYFEPFVGGGALLLHLKPEQAFINDINRELIHTYREIRDHLDQFILDLSEMDKATCTREFYYEMRARYNEKQEKSQFDTEMAALFVYLNKHCFNGLYRVNGKGMFNVPWNSRMTGKSLDIENIKRISYFLKDVTITSQDFSEAVKDAQKGDFIYFDSPYAPLNASSFESYTKDGFTQEQHRRLAELFGELSGRGCYCMLTNHDTELIRSLYTGFSIEETDVRRAINSDGKKRMGKEVIIKNY